MQSLPVCGQNFKNGMVTVSTDNELSYQMFFSILNEVQSNTDSWNSMGNLDLIYF